MFVTFVGASHSHLCDNTACLYFQRHANLIMAINHKLFSDLFMAYRYFILEEFAVHDNEFCCSIAGMAFCMFCLLLYI